jgi:pyridoxal phosphate-dependent aminotransferase EpsN
VSHYEHTELGYNYRMSNVLAGIGRGQLRVIEDRIDARRRVFERYREALSHLGEIQWMPQLPETRPTRWLSACVLDDARTALSPRMLIKEMSSRGIEARPLWKPMHRQPLFARCDYIAHGCEPSVSDRLFERGLCLPSGSNLTRQEQDRIIQAIDEAVTVARSNLPPSA